MKKFQTLGKELTRPAMKKITGGSDPKDGGGGTPCNCNSADDCKDPAKPKCYNGQAYECTAGTYVGWCEK